MQTKNENPQKLFRKRTPDYQKIKVTNEDKALLKKTERFFPTSGDRFGGNAGTLGPQLRVSSKKEGLPKKYYLAMHKAKEYFIMETLCRIGLNTPKSRLSVQKKGSDGSEYQVELVSTDQ